MSNFENIQNLKAPKMLFISNDSNFAKKLGRHPEIEKPADLGGSVFAEKVEEKIMNQSIKIIFIDFTDIGTLKTEDQSALFNFLSLLSAKNAGLTLFAIVDAKKDNIKSIVKKILKKSQECIIVTKDHSQTQNMLGIVQEEILYREAIDILKKSHVPLIKAGEHFKKHLEASIANL